MIGSYRNQYDRRGVIVVDGIRNLRTTAPRRALGVELLMSIAATGAGDAATAVVETVDGRYSATQLTNVDCGLVGHANPLAHQVCCWISRVIGSCGISLDALTTPQTLPSTT